MYVCMDGWMDGCMHVCIGVGTFVRAHRRGPHAQRPRRIEDRNRQSAFGALPTQSGAYLGQVGDARGVPRADVRVERGRLAERLRAGPRCSPHAVQAAGKCSHIALRIRVRPKPTRTQAHSSTHHVGASVGTQRACIGDPFIDVGIGMDDRYMHLSCI